MMRRWLLALALTACHSKVIDLGIDAPPADSAKPMPDAATCRCRITPCRLAGDCTLTGGVCGPDFYCVGDFGACSTDSQCQATVATSACTKATDSTVACQ